MKTLIKLIKTIYYFIVGIIVITKTLIYCENNTDILIID